MHSRSGSGLPLASYSFRRRKRRDISPLVVPFHGCDNAIRFLNQILREDEDWSFLRDRALRRDFWDPIKYIRLRGGYDDWFMTIGGEAREVWEQIGNDNWGQQPIMNGYLDERYMLYFDVHYGRHVRTFVELKSGLNSYRFGGPRPIDEKKLDFQAAFLEVGTSTGANSVALRAGRLELEYGLRTFD
jgi:Alginate export